MKREDIHSTRRMMETVLALTAFYLGTASTNEDFLKFQLEADALVVHLDMPKLTKKVLQNRGDGNGEIAEAGRLIARRGDKMLKKFLENSGYASEYKKDGTLVAVFLLGPETELKVRGDFERVAGKKDDEFYFRQLWKLCRKPEPRAVPNPYSRNDLKVLPITYVARAQFVTG